MEVISRDPEGTFATSRRLLVVDDEQPIGHLITRIMGRSWRTTALTNSAAALRHIEAGERYGCILCDLTMPDMPGSAFFEAVRRVDVAQSDRIIFMTGGVGLEGVDAFLRTVGNRCLMKPFTFATLRDAVEGTSGDESFLSGVWARGGD